jgi:hypothetical protein
MRAERFLILNAATCQQTLKFSSAPHWPLRGINWGAGDWYRGEVAVNSEKLQVRHTSAIAIREKPLPRFQPLPVFCLLDSALETRHCVVPPYLEHDQYF